MLIEILPGKLRTNIYNTNFYVNTDEAFDDPAIQAVVICLPNHLHTPVSLKATEKTKHVLVEKPFALSVKDAVRMIGTAHAKNLVLMCGQSFRFFKAVQEAKKRIKTEIGEPFSVL
jgi:predicted dehydrogenase